MMKKIFSNLHLLLEIVLSHSNAEAERTFSIVIKRQK